jgi:hypothetical protein
LYYLIARIGINFVVLSEFGACKGRISHASREKYTCGALENKNCNFVNLFLD